MGRFEQGNHRTTKEKRVAAFFCKLHPPRQSFLADMTTDERAVMASHAEYWKEWMAKGHVVAFGVVGDPAGVYGVGLVEFDDAAAVHEFTSNDPTIRSDRGFRWEVLPMPFGVVYPRPSS
jgi:uncharacterized protein